MAKENVFFFTVKVFYKLFDLHTHTKMNLKGGKKKKKREKKQAEKKKQWNDNKSCRQKKGRRGEMTIQKKKNHNTYTHSKFFLYCDGGFRKVEKWA